MNLPRVVATLAFAAIAAFAASDPFVGSWTVNVEKSKTGSGSAVPPGRMTIEATPDGYRIGVSGGTVTLHFDEYDYPREAMGIAKATGADVVNARRIDARTIETTFKRNGKAVATVRREVSADGHVLTATTDMVLTTGERRNAIEVFEKR
jgi:hypothetical protein